MRECPAFSSGSSALTPYATFYAERRAREGMTDRQAQLHDEIAQLKARIDDYRKMAIPADAIARAMAYAIGQPPNVDVNEILIRPTAQPT